MPSHTTDDPAAPRPIAGEASRAPSGSVADGHVRVTGLRKQLGDTLAVDGVSFDIAPGTLTCLLGPSGCGKTTTLRMVAGLLDPDEGDVRIGGRSMLGVPANRRPTSIVFQDYALFPHMTVRENVAFGLRRQRGDIAGVGTVDELLGVMSLDAVADRRPGSLSGGQQQRVALARSLALRPAVILMDEPLSNLDAKVRITLRAELRRIQQEFGTTILYVTHDQEEAMAIADEIVVLSAGRVQQIGTATEVYRRPDTPFVADFIGLGSWLDARCTAIDGDTATFAVDGGSVTVDRMAPRTATVGDVVVLFVRPEHVAPAPPDAADGVVATIRSRQFMGSFERLVLATDAGQLVLMDRHDESVLDDLDEGDEVTVRLAPHRVRVFDRAPGGAVIVGTTGGEVGGDLDA